MAIHKVLQHLVIIAHSSGICLLFGTKQIYILFSSVLFFKLQATKLVPFATNLAMQSSIMRLADSEDYLYGEIW